MLESICPIEVINTDTIHIALEIAGKYGFSWYDSLIVAAALKAECDILYSEDMHHSQVIEGKLSVINPFFA